jgi:hypothetical protein
MLQIVAMSAAIAVCENHLQREAIGVCVECRRRVCSECSTKVEGINYCVACLARLAREGGRLIGARARPALRAVYAAAGAYLALLTAGLWLLLEFLLPGS